MYKLTITILFLFFIIIVNAQSKLILGGVANYHQGIGLQKKVTSPLLFLNNAQSAGLEIVFAKKESIFSFNFTTEFITGTNDKDAISAYAKENKIAYTFYKFNKANPMGFSAMLGPRIVLFPKAKKMPIIYTTLQAGAIFSNQQSIQYRETQAIITKEIKSSPVSFAYKPSITIVPFKTKKLMFPVTLGYSNFGGITLGVGITEMNCAGLCCAKCPGFGNSCCLCSSCDSKLDGGQED